MHRGWIGVATTAVEARILQELLKLCGNRNSDEVDVFVRIIELYFVFKSYVLDRVWVVMF